MRIFLALAALLATGPALAQAKAPPTHSSCATAVALEAPSHMEGVSSQYEFLEQHYPGYRPVQQALSDCGGKPTDVMTLENAQGQRVEVFFDLSGYFGKGF